MWPSLRLVRSTRARRPDVVGTGSGSGTARALGRDPLVPSLKLRQGHGAAVDVVRNRGNAHLADPCAIRTPQYTDHRRLVNRCAAMSAPPGLWAVDRNSVIHLSIRLRIHVFGALEVCSSWRATDKRLQSRQRRQDRSGCRPHPATPARSTLTADRSVMRLLRTSSRRKCASPTAPTGPSPRFHRAPVRAARQRGRRSQLLDRVAVQLQPTQAGNTGDPCG